MSDNVIVRRRFTRRFSDLAAASTTSNVELYKAKATEIILATQIKHVTPFRGGAITTYTLSLGVANNLTKYGSAFDVFQPAIGRAYQVSLTIDSEDSVAVRLSAVSTGGNLNAATQGEVEVVVFTLET